MIKRIFCSILCICLLCVGSFSINAATNTAQPRYNYTSSTIVNISIPNGVANCTAQLTGYSSTDKIRITMTLQKKGVLWWNEVDTWTTTYYDSVATMTKTKSVSSGKYRVKAEFTAYCGSNSEDITDYSLECQY